MDEKILLEKNKRVALLLGWKRENIKIASSPHEGICRPDGSFQAWLPNFSEDPEWVGLFWKKLCELVREKHSGWVEPHLIKGANNLNSVELIKWANCRCKDEIILKTSRWTTPNLAIIEAIEKLKE